MILFLSMVYAIIGVALFFIFRMHDDDMKESILIIVLWLPILLWVFIADSKEIIKKWIC